MQICNTKRNHFVPKFYLKNFVDKNEFIYFFDKKTKEFRSTKALSSVAFKEDLYTIENKISQADINCFCNIFEISVDSEEKKFFIDTLQNFLNDEFTKLFEFNIKNEDIQKYLSTILDSPDLSRNQELLFSLYENDFKPILEYITKYKKMKPIKESKVCIFVYIFSKILSFILKKIEQKILMIDPSIKGNITPVKNIELYSQNPYYDLLHYVLVQYFRTNKIINIDSIKKATTNPAFKVGDISPNANNIVFLFIHYHILNIAEKIIQQNYKIILLKNYTNKIFFTSDNPSINSHSKLIQDFGLDNIDYEVYFPLSPKIALLLTKTPIDKNYDKQKLEIIIDNEEQIDYWNKLIFDMSERFIYSSSQEELELFIEKLDISSRLEHSANILFISTTL